MYGIEVSSTMISNITDKILPKIKEKWKSKYTKKSLFSLDESLMKCLYPATVNITKKWNKRYCNWNLILEELSIIFEGRI